MSNFIYYEKLEDYEEQVRKAKECDEKDKEIERLKEELKYTIPIVEHNKTITKHLKEIEKLNNIIKELELCNSDYYYQIFTLSSKLARINKYISDSNRALSVDSYYKFEDLIEFDEIKEIIFDKTIMLGSDKE